jgi:hypothetical protein
MKNIKNIKNNFILILLLAITACQKDQISNSQLGQKTSTTTVANITIEEAKTWLATQNDTITSKYPIRWENARSIKTKTGNRIILKIPGAPKINNTKLGYRQLSIQRNPETKNIEAKFLEIIPDPIYWQEKQKVESKDFTGKIMEFDLNYKLEKGMIYQSSWKTEAPAYGSAETASSSPHHWKPLEPIPSRSYSSTYIIKRKYCG